MLLSYPTTRYLGITLCCWFLSGPLLPLQMVAWTWMIVDYAAESTWSQAVEETFSGERPCELCLAIQAAEDQSRERSDTQIAVSTELKFFARERDLIDPPQGCVLSDPPRSTDSWDSIDYEIPEPPPRSQV